MSRVQFWDIFSKNTNTNNCHLFLGLSDPLQEDLLTRLQKKRCIFFDAWKNEDMIPTIIRPPPQTELAGFLMKLCTHRSLDRKISANGYIIGGLGPGGLDSWRFPCERECYLGASLESQTTGPQTNN